MPTPRGTNRVGGTPRSTARVSGSQAAIGHTPARRALIARLRDRGANGRRILPHRAMLRLETTPLALLRDLALLPLAAVVLVALALPSLTALWEWSFAWLRPRIGLPGTIVVQRFALVSWFGIDVPHFTADTVWPDRPAMIVGWITMAVLGLAGTALRGRWLPVAYLLRALAVLQLSANLFFTLVPPPFPYTLPQYQAGFLACGIVVLLLVPFVAGATYFVFDVSLSRKLAFLAMTLVHLAVLIPLQSVVHVWWIWHASYLAMPVLFLIFGLLLDVCAFVTLYGWAMSWRSDR